MAHNPAEKKREYQRRWRAANPERSLEHSRKGARLRKERGRVYPVSSVRNAVYKRNYGITLADYEAMFAAQGGLCAICEKPQIAGRAKNLAVDHCHQTGEVRALLCTRCNSALSWLEGPLRPAMDAYLEKYGKARK